MKKRFILYSFALSALLSLGSVTAKADTKLPGKCTAFLPKVLMESVLKETSADKLLKDPSWGQSDDPGAGKRKYWVVYSDRSDNQTYASASKSSEKFTKLSFNQKLVVAKVEKGFALVYSEPREGSTYPEISSHAKSMGWVPMENLLLWSNCLANERDIYYKALLCLNLDQTRKEYLGAGFLNPDKRGNVIRLSTDMNFYFVMKRLSDGCVLLSKQHTLSGNTNEVLKCWVTPESYIPWNQRSCLEPNWDVKTVDYFSSNGISAKIYENMAGTKQISRVDYKANQGTDLTRYRMPARSLRYPILDGCTDNMYHCSVFSAMGGAVNDPEMMINKQKEQEAKSLKALSELRLAIVIDGTTSMDQYFKSVRDAITEACNFFDKSKYNIKVAVVIYRDYPDGDGLVEKLDWCDPTSPRLTEFLQTGGAYGIKSAPTDRTHTEAVFYGINYAIDNLKFNKQQSNIMLVVGDCGNAQDDPQAPTMNEIAMKLAENKIHFMGFQVRNEDIFDWSLFNNQMTKILQASLQKKYDDLIEGTKMVFHKDSQGFTLENRSSTLFVGAHRYAVNGGALPAVKLTQLMVESIKYCAESIKSQQGVITRQGQGFVSSNEDFQKLQIDSAFLRERMGKEYFDRLKTINSLMTFAAYTPKVDKASGYQYYKPIIFISSEELQQLIYRLAKVDETARMHTDDREPYLAAMRALVRSMLPDITEDEISRKGDREIMNLVAGLNETSAALKGRTLAQIADKTVVTRSEYDKMLDNFQKKYRKLKSIVSDRNYKYAYDFNGSKYYWIPIEDLP